MNAAKVALTEAAVLDEALAFFAKPGTFTPEAYFRQGSNRSYTSTPSTPGEHVGATCAIGGIEQAIWRLTGKNVSDSRRPLAYLPDETAKLGNRADIFKVYGRVMGRLNRLAREMYGDKLEVDDVEPINIEELTGHGNDNVAKRRVLKILRAARAEVDS